MKREKILLNGKFLGVSEDENTFEVYKTFSVAENAKAVLSVTAYGLYHVLINGRAVTDTFFHPGFTPYRKLLQVQEYDISPFLKRGENEIAVIVNEGWYCGNFNRTQKIFGDKPSVLFSIRFDDGREIVSDLTCKARSLFISRSDIYNGETQDFVAEKRELTLIAYDHDKNNLVAQMCEYVGDQDEIAVKEVINAPNGDLIFDFGQNLAGVAYIKVKAYEKVVVSFCEVLDGEGNFYQGNLRGALATDSFLSEKDATVFPIFTYHGFRYMKVVTKNLSPEDVVVKARYTKLPRTGEITTSNGELSQLISNVFWSQRSNFFDIPTDCPQRAERLGWTGDINVFLNTAAYNYDVCRFMKKYLAGLRCDQYEDGTLPYYSPNAAPWEPGKGSCDAMWSDAIVMIPYKLYRHYGDISFLRDNYAAMKKYISAHEKLLVNGLMRGGHQYGDWLAMDSDDPEKLSGETSKEFIADAFYYHCLCLMAEISRTLGDGDYEEEMKERRGGLYSRMREEYFTAEGLKENTVTAEALAIALGLVGGKEREELAARLNARVIANGYRTVTGFIGTPYLLPVLFDCGYFDTAERVLFNKKLPGWFYEIDRGATTIWEKWNAIMENGTFNQNGLPSFNHYSHGAVLEFIYSRLAGIRPVENGFKKVLISPFALKRVDKLEARFQTDQGVITSGYERNGRFILYRIGVPPHTLARIKIDGVCDEEAGEGFYEYKKRIEVENG